eukprot:1731356-Alexandrium_andersonii.AAC.1
MDFVHAPAAAAATAPPPPRSHSPEGHRQDMDISKEGGGRGGAPRHPKAGSPAHGGLRGPHSHREASQHGLQPHGDPGQARDARRPPPVQHPPPPKNGH